MGKVLTHKGDIKKPGLPSNNDKPPGHSEKSSVPERSRKQRERKIEFNEMSQEDGFRIVRLL
jgi:hypothetical protein